MNENTMKILIMICFCIFFAGVFYTVFLFFSLLKQYEILKNAWEKSLKVLDAQNQTRKRIEKQTVSLYGEMEKRTFIAKLDAILAYSGLYRRFPGLTAEKSAAGMLTALGLITMLLWFITGKILIGMGAAGLMLCIAYESFHTMRAIRKRKIDAEILHCLDMMEMTAVSSRDVLSIIGKTAVKIKEPLRAELLSAVVDAEHSGDTSQALRRLTNRIENKYLKDLLLNLDICSKYTESYQDVLKASKKIFLQDSVNREKLRKLYKNTLQFILVMTGIGIFCLQAASRLMAAEENVIFLLWHSGTAGQVILLYLLCVITGSIWHSGMKALG